MSVDTIRCTGLLSPVCSWGNPTQRPNDDACRHDQRAVVVSASLFSTSSRAQTQVSDAAPVRKPIRWLSGCPAQKGPRAKHRVPRRWLDAALANNALRSLAPVPPQTNAHAVRSTGIDSGTIGGINTAPS